MRRLRVLNFWLVVMLRVLRNTVIGREWHWVRADLETKTGDRLVMTMRRTLGGCVLTEKIQERCLIERSRTEN